MDRQTWTSNENLYTVFVCSLLSHKMNMKQLLSVLHIWPADPEAVTHQSA